MTATVLDPRLTPTRPAGAVRSPSEIASGPARSRSSVGSARLLQVAGLEIAALSSGSGSVRLLPGARRCGIVLAEDLHEVGAPVADDFAVRVPASATTVWVHDDGTVSLRATFAPPALLVRPGPHEAEDEVVLFPEVPGAPGSPTACVLRPGERLVVLTALAFDAVPEEITRLVRGEAGAPECLRASDAAHLLSKLLRHAPGAAGAVVTRSR